MATLPLRSEVATPTAHDADVARASSRALAPHVGEASLRLRVEHVQGTDDEVVLPPPAARLLLGILTEMGRGNAVAVSPVQTELTTDHAADLLNVSRPHLITLLYEGAIPFRTVGPHRRLRLEAVMAYRKEVFANRLSALDELTAFSQELGLYDDPMR